MPNFETIERQLRAAKVDLNPAEAHGLLCGLLCHLKKGAHERWIDELLNEEGVPSASLKKLERLLSELYSESEKRLNAPDFSFELLLPEAKRPISERSQALGLWCQGFLYGVGLAVKSVEKKLSELGREALKDLTEIAWMESDSVEASDESESALIELEEFLRVAALTIHADLLSEREPQQ